MKLESAMDLKQKLMQNAVERLDGGDGARPLAIVASLRGRAPRRSIALGVAQRAADDYVLAVRLQQPGLEGSEWVESIRREANGEVVS